MCKAYAETSAKKLEGNAIQMADGAAAEVMASAGISSETAHAVIDEAKKMATFAFRGAKQMLDGEKWRCREQAAWFTLRFQARLRDENRKDAAVVENDVQQMVVRRRALESSKGIQALFKNPDAAMQVQKALEAKWEDEKDRVERELKGSDMMRSFRWCGWIPIALA